MAHGYHPISILYQHGDTTVYLAYHPNLQQKLILKEVSKGTDSYFRARMESVLLRTIDHPCIPHIYDVLEDEKAIILVEEFMQGETLYSICQATHISFSDILFYSIQLCNILSYLHDSTKPILHLDLNPRNILIDQLKVNLIDFSASSFLCSSSGTSRYGTPPYAAPELYNNQTLDVTTDVYGIGKIMEYMMSNVVKEKKDAVQEREIRAIKNIIARCTKKKKRQRYSNLHQVIDQLMQLSLKVKSTIQKELVIGVAGAQSHIGTTHMAFGLCSYLRKYGRTCLYEEHNEPSDIKFLIMDQGRLEQNGYYTYENIPMVWGKGNREEFDVIVADYGVLSKENAFEYESCDLRLLVYGDKPYERDRANCLLQRFPEVLIDWGIKNFTGRSKRLPKPEVRCRYSCYEVPFFTKDEFTIEPVLEVILASYV